MATTQGSPLPHAPNFRDLGGYTGADGKTVRRGLLFRSDALSDLDQREQDALTRMGIRTVIDFRDRGEVLYNPDLLPDPLPHRENIPIEAGRLMSSFDDGHLNARKTTAMMLSVYRSLVHDCQPAFRDFFRIITSAESLPAVFHCTAGKDRTGFAAALFLSALGVPRDTIMADYLLSNENLKNKYVAGVDYDDSMLPLYTVAPEYLAAAFEAVDNEYTGVHAFLRDRLGVDLDRLTEMYLE